MTSSTQRVSAPSGKLKTPLIAPSILSSDFAHLGREIKSAEAAGANWLHIDVMDGHFVPNLTLGPILVEAIRPITQLPLDCHLMVSEPAQWVEPFAKAGADVITVHVESTPHINRVLHQIRESGCRAGVSLNPGSPLVLIEEVLDIVDLVLVMSVNPGYGGQKFIETSIPKIEKLSQMRDERKFWIEVDGGVRPENIGRLFQAGVDIFVAGSAVFSSPDRNKAITDLKTHIGTR